MGLYQYTVMPFGLKNAPTIFWRVVVATFKEYIHMLLEVYFNDWKIFGLLKKHVASLRLMLNTCQKYRISLNIKKCIFYVHFGILLGHSLQAMVYGGYYKDCYYSEFASNKDSETASHYIGTHSANGEAIEERCGLSME